MKGHDHQRAIGLGETMRGVLGHQDEVPFGDVTRGAASMPVPVMLLAFTRRPPRSLRIAWVHHALSKAHRKTYETQWEKIRNEHVAHTGLVDPTAQWEEPKPEPAVIVSSIPEG
jgi:hypothetical protein